mgnify:CR=1 FL=1
MKTVYFYYHNQPNLIYNVDVEDLYPYNDGEVKIKWICESSCEYKSMFWSLKDMEENLLNGLWVKCSKSGEPLTLKGERIGERVKLTKQISGIVQKDGSLLVETKQVVGGGGSRNLVTWSLYAFKKGYKKVLISAKIADDEALEGIEKAIKNANDLLNIHGMVVELA